MKKRSINSIFANFRNAADRLNAVRSRCTNDRAPKTRAARLEALESREMLAVSAAEYAALRAEYAEFDLPASTSSIGVIEIPSDSLSAQALKDAIEQAASTKTDDLIVVRTTANANTIKFAKASDQISVEMDADIFGKTTIVALGDAPLTIDANRAARALTLAVGELALGNIDIVNGSASNYGGNVYNRGVLTIKNCDLSAGSATASGLGANLYSSGELYAFDSSFNNALDGFSVYSVGKLELVNSEMARNAGNGLYVESDHESVLTSVGIENNAGVGVENKFGVLTIVDSTLSNNGSYGLLNEGAASVSTSVVENNGASGALNRSFFAGTYVSASLSVTRSKIVGNRSERGAAVDNIAGMITLSNCEFSQNAASDVGGAVYCEYQTGYVNKATIVNCTIAGNTAQSQAGGVYIAPSFGCAIYNTVVSMNYAGGIDVNAAGEFTSKGNLIDASASFVNAPVFDYATGTLANPGKLDLRLAAGSAAVNIGDSSRVASGALDLAGAARIFGKSVDAGAYEYRNTGEKSQTPVYLVTTLDDSFNLNDSKISLREALYFANDPSATIEFASNLSGVIKLTSQLQSTAVITIDGGNRVTIDAQNASRAFLVENDLTLKNLTIVNGKSDGAGGLIYADAPIAVVGSTLENAACGPNALGGLVYANSTFNAIDSAFKNAAYGDALYLLGNASLTNTVVSGAAQNGVYVKGSASMNGVVVSQNANAGIVNDYGSLALTRTTVEQNGGVGIDNIGAATLTNCVVNNNGDSGLFNRSVVINDSNVFVSTVEASNTIFKGNKATYGAGVYNKYGRIELTNCELSANSASKEGGALYCDAIAKGGNTTTLRNVTIAGNYAGVKGGGIAVANVLELFFLYNSIVSMNLTGDLDANVSGEVSMKSGSVVGLNPGFVTAPIFDYANKKLTNADQLDLRLTQNSAVLDSALNANVVKTNTTDLLGNPRVYNKTVDPGAYEYQGTGETSPKAVYLVNSLSDTFNLADTKTTLREALYLASKDGATITFANSLNGTIKLTSQLVATSNVTIDGGNRVTISGQSKTRVLLNEANVRLANITLTSGKSSSLGTVVYNQGTLTLQNAVVSSGVSSSKEPNANVYSVGALNAYVSTISDAKSASGVYASGAVVMSDCVVKNNAQYGLYLTGTSKLSSTAIQNNTSGGVYNRYGSVDFLCCDLADNADSGLINLGSATLDSCRVYGNQNSGLLNLSETYADASRFSATLRVYRSAIKGNASSSVGGGVYNYGGFVELSNSEISANIAAEYGAGVANVCNPGCLNKTNLINCTIAGNSAAVQGGGVYVDSQDFILCMYNTIVARNYAAHANVNVEGPVVESVRNLTSGNPAFIVDPIFSDEGVLQNADALNLRLTAASVAVDLGDNNHVAGSYDLDLAPRVFNKIVDLGAYEYVAESSTHVTTLDDSFDLNDGVVSLREALYFAEPGNVVDFDSALVGEIELTSTLVVDKDATIVGSGKIAVSGSNAVQILKNNAALTLENLTFTDGRSDSYGGAIYNSGALNVINCSFKYNKGANGGAIYNKNGATLSLENASFSYNAATSLGGAIYNQGAVSVTASAFSNNSANASAGAVYNNGTLTIVNSILVDNTANVFAGAIYNTQGALTLVNSTIANNAAQNAGGLYLASGTAKLYNTIVALDASDDVQYATCVITACNVLSSFVFATGVDCVLYDAALPLFADADRGDYRLADNSQALDLGADSLARQYGLGSYAFDMAKTPRYLGSAIDLGAYEYVSADIQVQENADFRLKLDCASTDKVYWDLSGTGSGKFVQKTADFWLNAADAEFAPGLYKLRYKIVTKNGTVKTQQSIMLQVVKVSPLIVIEKVDVPIENAAVFSVEARFFAQTPNCTWRVDWGDGSYATYEQSAFVAGKIYNSPNVSTYVVSLTMVGADGIDEQTFQLGKVETTFDSVNSSDAIQPAGPALKTANAVLENVPADAIDLFADFPEIPTFDVAAYAVPSIERTSIAVNAKSNADFEQTLSCVERQAYARKQTEDDRADAPVRTQFALRHTAKVQDSALDLTSIDAILENWDDDLFEF